MKNRTVILMINSEKKVFWKIVRGAVIGAMTSVGIFAVFQIYGQTPPSAARQGTRPTMANLGTATMGQLPGLIYYDASNVPHVVALDASLTINMSNPNNYIISAVPATTVKPPVIEYTTLGTGQTAWTTALAANPAWPVRVFVGGWLMQPQTGATAGDYTTTTSATGTVTITINTSAQVIYAGEVVAVEYTPL